MFRKALVNTFLSSSAASAPISCSVWASRCCSTAACAGKRLWRVLYFLPVITAPLALGVMFAYIFNRNYGLINSILVLGHSAPAISGEPISGAAVIIIMAMYQYIGYYIVIFVAGLQGIPQDYYDAASVDGANAWQDSGISRCRCCGR